MDVRAEVVVRPGALHFGRDDERVRTLLGSCVAVTVWHPRSRAGGMCHFVVPTRGRDAERGAELDGRYGDEALELLAERARSLCTDLRDYEVRMFGGGNQFVTRGPAGGIAIPARNVEAARRLAERHGLTVVRTDLGGRGAREIVLDLASGAVTSRRAGTETRSAS